MTDPCYLGDGVYATFDGFQIWLTTERDKGPERIALEPAVFQALFAYAIRVEMIGKLIDFPTKPNK